MLWIKELGLYNAELWAVCLCNVELHVWVIKVNKCRNNVLCEMKKVIQFKIWMLKVVLYYSSHLNTGHEILNEAIAPYNSKLQHIGLLNDALVYIGYCSSVYLFDKLCIFL